MDSMDHVCPLKEPPLWHDGIVFSLRFTSFHLVIAFVSLLAVIVKVHVFLEIYFLGCFVLVTVQVQRNVMLRLGCHKSTVMCAFSLFSLAGFQISICSIVTIVPGCSDVGWSARVGQSEFLICVACCCVKNWGMFSNCLQTNHLAIQNGMHDPITPKQRACYAYVGRYAGMLCK